MSRHQILFNWFIVFSILLPATALSAPERDKREQAIIRAYNDSGFDKDFVFNELIFPGLCVLSKEQFMGCYYGSQFMLNELHGDPEKNVILDFANQSPDGIRGQEIRKLNSHFSMYEEIPVVLEATPKDKKETSSEKKDREDRNSVAISSYNRKLVAHKEDIHTRINAFYKNEIHSYQKNIDHHSSDIKKQLQELSNDFIANHGKGVFDIWEKAVDKQPPMEQNWFLSQFYNVYLQFSTDGRSAVTLKRRVQVEYGVFVNQSFFGIGALLQKQEEHGNMIYLKPLRDIVDRDTGERIQLRDKLVSVTNETQNGKKTLKIDEEVSTQKAADVIRGEKDTYVTLEVQKWGQEETVHLKIKREPYATSGYTADMGIQHNGANIGLIEIQQFQGRGYPGDLRLCQDIKNDIIANDSKVEGWVINLSNNPGGLLIEAECIADLFHAKGTKLVGTTQFQILDQYIALRDSITSKPVVIVINGRSASASEIVAGVFQETGRALIVGQTSYGKGSTQTTNQKSHPAFPHLDTMRHLKMISYQKTSGYYFFPSGVSPEHTGVRPDIVVNPEPHYVEVYNPKFAETHPWAQKATLRSGALNEDRNSFVRECMAAEGIAQEVYDAGQSPFSPNYQVLSAFDALKCLLNYEKP